MNRPINVQDAIALARCLSVGGNSRVVTAELRNAATTLATYAESLEAENAALRRGINEGLWGNAETIVDEDGNVLEWWVLHDDKRFGPGVTLADAVLMAASPCPATQGSHGGNLVWTPPDCSLYKSAAKAAEEE